MSDLGEQPDQSGWCPDCKAGDHSHHAPQFAGICIGCSCPARVLEGSFPHVQSEADDEYDGADADDFTQTDTDERPSELLTAEELDHALLLLIVSADGKTRMWIEPTVDPGQLAKGLRRTAKSLERSRDRTVETVRTMLDPS